MSVRLSVVIPCRNAAVGLKGCLAALAAEKWPALECIVVDDASEDGSADVATACSLNVRLIRLPKRRGSAVARNIGARSASGDILIFLDADVLIHERSLFQISAAFEDDPNLGALIGSYDDKPVRTNFYSQYRNLLHCYVHQTSPGRASTFWTGCGAIRRTLFLDNGGFGDDPNTVDDIELGNRLVRQGIFIELRPDIQVTHQKRWTFTSTLKTDMFLRGIPWSLLILNSRSMPNTLNVGYRNRASVAFICLAILAFLAGATSSVLLFPVALGFLGASIFLNRRFYGFLRERKGKRFALNAIPAHCLHFLVCGLSFFLACLLFLSRRTSVAGQEQVGLSHSVLEDRCQLREPRESFGD